MNKRLLNNLLSNQGLILYSLLVIGFLSVEVQAQEGDSIYKFQYQFPNPVQSFTTDQLQQCYLVTPQNEVIKYNNAGNIQFRFNNNRLGELAFVDATDPFNLLLYYPEFLTVILLDRTLSQTGEYNLYDLDVVEVKALGLSNDNNLWIYDDVSFKVKKINQQNGETLVQSDDLSLVLGLTIQPNFIIERQNWVFVNDPNIGVLQFDLFGQYVKTLDINGLEQFQIHDNRLIYQKEGQLFAFHLESLNTQKIPLPEKVKGKIQVQKNRMYVQTGEELRVYSYK